MAVTIACVSGKGGVGKTTTCASLGGALAERGRRVLAVDMDPQSNLTAGLGFNPYTLDRTVADLIASDTLAPAEVVIPTAWGGLSLIPANPDLSAIENEISTGLNRELRLRDSLRRAGGYGSHDVLLVDTPPNFGFHTISVMAAADWILIPVQMSGYAIKGLKEVLRTVAAARQRLNPDLRVIGLVPTFVNLRTRFSREMLDGLREIPHLHVFNTIVKVTVKLQETALAGVPITTYATASEAAAAYRSLADEILVALGQGGQVSA